MEIVVLGSGTLVPQVDRASAGVCVVEDDRMLPIDLGRNVLSRYVECGIDPLAAEQWLFTHLHPDHSCELVSLLFACNYAPGGPRERPLRLTGPKGLRELVTGLGRAWPWLEPKFPLEVQEIGPGEVPVGVSGFEVRAIRLEHGNTENLGYRVRSRAGGGTVAFTGDTGPCPALLDLGRDVDVLVSECAATDEERSPFHLAPTALGRAAAAAAVRHLVVTHLYPANDPATVLARIRAEYGGRLTLASDRLRVSADSSD